MIKTAEEHISVNFTSPKDFIPFVSKWNVEEDTQLTQIALTILSTTQKTKISAPISNIDVKWDTITNTSMYRYRLENDTRVYVKPFYNNFEEYGEDRNDYGVSVLKKIINEARAYIVAEALGLKHLVPTTILREVEDGFLCSVQEEAKKCKPKKRKKLSTAFYSEDLRQAGWLDYVIGSQDRHDDNYISVEDNGFLRLKLIDNSYSFPVRESYFVNYADFNKKDIDLTDEDISKLSIFLKQLNTLKQYFTEKELTYLRTRVENLIKNKVVYMITVEEY